MIATLSLIIGKEREANALVDNIRGRKTAIEEAAARITNRPRVYYMISFGDAGDFTAGRGTFISSLIASAGGINTADSIAGWQFTVEALFHEEPDIILCGSGAGGMGGGSLEALRRTPPYNRLRAVREGRVYIVDNNLLDRIGPRNIEGLETLARIFQGDIFP